ncbi:hypothetical protein [Pseudanabaena sp. UWO310]|uniref:hypothetical protein n=1 Tax=Pseudanabaena sp. UWO310 TaxID=2480795 RepID=UPI0011602560|nr:hypothetical protein [Pseudanabaena sp. UWO310]TYQ25157.1 hypothetical protein PseudUWO310_19535 [Pseudanabaena sp. UWO310]
MNLDIDEDIYCLLELIFTCSGVPISAYTLAKVLTRKEHPLSQDFPKIIQSLEAMLKDGLIQRESINAGYVISEKGKKVFTELKS